MAASKLGLSAIHMRRGDYQTAEKLIKQSIKLAPTYTEAYVNLAHLDYRTGRFEKAAKTLDQLLKVSKASAQCHCLLARCYLRMGKPKAARLIMDERPPVKSSTEKSPFCELVQAELLYREGRDKEATAILEKMAALSTDSVDFSLDLARLSLEQDNPAQARRFLERVEVIDPQNPYLEVYRIWLSVIAEGWNPGFEERLLNCAKQNWNNWFYLNDVRHIFDRAGRSKLAETVTGRIRELERPSEGGLHAS